jgi:hypothetical protein
MEVKPLPWNVLPKGNYSQLRDQNDALVASDMELADAKYIAELVHREWKFRESLVQATPNAYPFAVAYLSVPGRLKRYFVTRRVVGGIYSDYFEHEKEAEHARHTLESEESDKEQLRYRIWQLEQLLREAYGHVTLLATGELPPLSNAELCVKLGDALEKTQ